MLSARSAAALRAHGQRMGQFARAASDADLTAAGPGLARRPVLAHRAVIVAASRDELGGALDALAAGQPHPALQAGVAGREAAPVFVFPGQGAQWAGMAAELSAASETFAADLGRCADALAPHVGWPVLDVLTGADGAPGLDQTEVVQPALFAMMVALARLWQAAGVEPVAVIGHSQGEIAAAHIAGALTLDQAARVSAVRSQVIGALDGTGGVLAVGLPAAQARQRIAAWPGRLWVAADNGPAGSVVAGDLDAIDELAASLGDQVQAKRAPVAYAAHTPHVEAVRDDLLDRIGDLAPADTSIGICSSCAGDYVAGTDLTAGYWYRNLAGEVRFDAAVRAVDSSAPPLFIEVSPHPILAGAVAEILADAGRDGAAVGTLRRGAGGPRQFLTALGAAWVRGAAVRWPDVTGPVRRHIELPTYPFERQRFWLASGGRPAGGPVSHPLLHAALPVAGSGGLLLTGRLSRRIAPWLADHAVSGTALAPGTAIADLALQAAAATGAGQVEDLTLHAPLPLPAAGAVQVQVAAGAPGPDGRRPLTIHSRPDGDPAAPWTQHASGTLAGPAVAPAPLVAWPPAGAEPVDLDGAYDRLAARGYGYGPAFRGLTAAWRLDGELYAEVTLPEPAGPAGDYSVHPALLDAALHPLLLALPPAAGAGLLLPFSWSGVWLRGRGATRLRVRLTGDAERGATVDLYDPAGLPVGGIAALTMRPAAGDGALATAGPDLYQVDWVPAGLDPVPAAGLAGRRWTVLGAGPEASELSRALRACGVAAGTAASLAVLPDPVPDVVLVPGPAEAEPGPGAARTAVHDALALVRDWCGDDRFARSRLVFLADHRSLAGAPVWGLVRSAQAEHPGRLALITPGALPAGAAGLLAAALDAAEPQAGLGDGQVTVPRLARCPAARPSGPVAGSGRGLAGAGHGPRRGPGD